MTRVLVVDDKDENLYYLRALLTGHGFAVEEARHGAEALIKARQQAPDLVISDLLMPVMDGYTLLRHWKADASLRQKPFIVYTATYTEAEDERLAYSLGADAFILKPAEPDDFLERIREVQARPRPSDGAATNVPAEDEAATLKVYSETLIRKLEEKTLQLEESNAELRLLTEVMPQIVWRSRPDGWISDGNRQWFAYTGLTVEEGIGHAWMKVLHPDDLDRSVQRWQRSLKSGETFETEYRMRRADGVYHWMLARALPLRDTDGNIIQWIGTCTDINELKAAEARISEQASLLDKTRDAIFVSTLDHVVAYMNRSAERIFGWRIDEVLGRSVLDVLRPEPHAFAEAMRQVLAEGEWAGELQKVTKTGVRLTLDCRWSLVRGDKGAPDSILAVETDVTERTLLEQQFLRAQRLESIGTLAGGIAHDLNNALGPILLSLELLKMATSDDERMALIETIEGSATRGAAMVRQVLSFARGVEGRRLPVQIGDLVRDIEKIANDTFLKNVTIRTSCHDAAHPVVGDPTQLHQVLLNLCVNARDAMADGGTLTLSVTNATLDAQQAARHHHAAPGAYVVVSVADSGSGMPPDVVDRIFEPFFTTKELGRGTGLGLSTSLAIVRSHGGFIEVESAPGVGSVFRVWLPADTTVADPPVPPDHAVLPRGHGQLILVVDDEETGRVMTSRALEAFGYRVLVARDGADAVTRLATHRDTIAAVVTDMMMPVMDGRALMEAMRTIAPSIPVIGTSGVDLDDAFKRAVMLRPEHFLLKPFTTETLLRTLDHVLAPGAGGPH